MVKKAKPTANAAAAGDASEADHDIVADTLRIVMELAPAFSAAVAARADALVRERWGGDRVYIARRRGEVQRSDRNAAIVRDYLAGERLGLLERRYGLSQRRLLQIIKTPGT